MTATVGPGARLGAYEVVSLLGEGGMGRVYRARDMKLNRDVAIKILPELFAADAERIARFTREAQTLAALNHPNIAQIFGLEEALDVRALVMELVQGDDLSTVIARGPIPLGEALPIARQIADALAAAHEQGIIHRDLKPANVKVRLDGTVKVLDFGLAKAMDPAGTLSEDAMRSPTLTARGTQAGMIIGTAAYMSPEQARGKAVDQRADIWAFGVVLYEMLSGRRAFAGTDISDVLAAVLKSEPDWTAIPDDTPASVRRLLRRCLEKEPRKRLSAIGDARLELDELEPAPVALPPLSASRSRLASVWPAVAAAVLTAAVAAILWPRTPAVPARGITRLAVPAPPGAQMYPDSVNVALSPDGTMVAFIVSSVTLADTQLWVRSLDSLTARRLEEGDGGALPFWSPDSKRIGFFSSDKLKTVSASGGRAEILCEVKDARGGAWSSSNVILFAPDAGGPLYRIPASGGTPTPATTLDPALKEYGHRFPTFLPDGIHFLFAALPGEAGKFRIFSGSLGDSSRTLVGTLDSAPAYADPGWLLYVRQGILAAHRFDPEARQLTGEAILLTDEPTTILDPAVALTAGRTVSPSRTGALAYFTTPSSNMIATWYDAAGRATGTVAIPPGQYESASISPDGTRAVFVRSTSASESALWLVDLARGSASPSLSHGAGRNDSPVWSPDGTRVVFAADRDGPQDLFVKRVDEAAPEESLYRSAAPFKRPLSWSPDGHWIIMSQLDAATAQNVWRISASGSPDAKKLVETRGRDIGGPVSPDGRWLAYVSDETGRYQLSIQSFPEPGRRIQVSQQGASRTWWTRDGRQLLFLDERMERLWRVDVEPGASPRLGPPTHIATLPPNNVWVDASPDRTRFLAIAPERTGPGAITIVHNWLVGVPK